MCVCIVLVSSGIVRTLSITSPENIVYRRIIDKKELAEKSRLRGNLWLCSTEKELDTSFARSASMFFIQWYVGMQV